MLLHTSHLGWVVPLLLTGLVPTASAQVTQVPPGSVRGLFGAGTPSSQLTLTFDLDAGYDDNTLPESETSADQFAPFQSGYVTTGEATLRYQKGRIERYVLGIGSGSVSQQQISTGLPSYRIIRGEGSLQAATGQGRRSGATMAVGTSYEPTYLFGAFSSLDRNMGSENPVEELPLPTEDTSLAMTEQRWLASRASGGAHYSWTPRQKLSAQYDGLWVQPIAGPGLESGTNSATIRHAWRPGSSIEFGLVYRYDHNAQVLDGDEQPLNLHTAEARVRYRHQRSPGRSVTLMLGVGAVQVRAGAVGIAPAFQDVAPTASAAVRFDLSRTSGISFSVRRDISVLNGLSVEPFKSDAAMLSVDATVARRLWIAATGGYSRGLALRSVDGDFDTTLLNAQVRYGFGTHVGLLVRYSYDDQRLRNVTVPTSFPPRYGRSSIRVGLTMWLPLYGSF